MMNEASTRRNRSTAVPGTEVEDVDKDFLYGEFEDGEQLKRRLNWERLRPDGWREKLAEKAAHKSLDIAREVESDDMEINAPRTSTTTNNGLSFRELLILSVLGSGVYLFSQRPQETPKPDPTPPVVDTDTDTVNVNRLEFADPL